MPPALITPMLVGAAVGAVSAAVQGGNILKGRCWALSRPASPTWSPALSGVLGGVSSEAATAAAAIADGRWPAGGTRPPASRRQERQLSRWCSGCNPAPWAPTPRQHRPRPPPSRPRPQHRTGADAKLRAGAECAVGHGRDAIGRHRAGCTQQSASTGILDTIFKQGKGLLGARRHGRHRASPHGHRPGHAPGQAERPEDRRREPCARECSLRHCRIALQPGGRHGDGNHALQVKDLYHGPHHAAVHAGAGPAAAQGKDLVVRQAMTHIIGGQARTRTPSSRRRRPATRREAVLDAIAPLLQSIYDSAQKAGAQVDMLTMMVAGIEVIGNVAGRCWPAPADPRRREEHRNLRRRGGQAAVLEHNQRVQGGGEMPPAAPGAPSR